MKTISKRIAITTASALSSALLTMGIASNAQAVAYTYSYGDVTLSVFNVTAGRLVDVTDFTSITPQNTSSAQADVNSIAGTSNTSSLISADTLLACQGDCGILENTFTQVNSGQFARSDTGASGSLITGLPQPTPANVDVMSEIRLDSNDIAGTSANSNNNTGFTFDLAEGVTVRFDLLANTFTQSFLDASAISPPSIVGSSHTWELTLLQGGNTICNWSPDGQGGGISGCNELSDNIDLTFGSTVSTPGANTGLISNSGSASAEIFLAPGSYTFRLAQFTSANATLQNEIPEPASLALLGIGLLGMFSFRQRANKAI